MLFFFTSLELCLHRMESRFDVVGLVDTLKADSSDNTDSRRIDIFQINDVVYIITPSKIQINTNEIDLVKA